MEQEERYTDQIIRDIRKLRKILHETPELSMQENRTKAILMQYLTENTKLTVVDRGAWFYAVYQAMSEEKKKTGSRKPIAFRADIDAVAGMDGNPGHYCGHDGHAAVLAGFAQILSILKPQRDVYLIFQPAEENGQGAMLCRNLLKEKSISEIYGFHNIPGYPSGTVLLRKATFACASTGLEITVTGTPSHAAYPEHGKNPAFILSKLVMKLPQYLQQAHRGILLATVIGLDVGSNSYGVSASKGVLCLTIRGEYQEEFEQLVTAISTDAKRYADAEGMQCRIQEIERFPSTENFPECTKKVDEAAQKVGLNVIYLQEPMRWSEDFGYYLQEIPGAFFGIGDGEEYPQLHTEAFCFPDEIIEDVLKVYSELLP